MGRPWFGADPGRFECCHHLVPHQLLQPFQPGRQIGDLRCLLGNPRRLFGDLGIFLFTQGLEFGLLFLNRLDQQGGNVGKGDGLGVIVQGLDQFGDDFLGFLGDEANVRALRQALFFASFVGHAAELQNLLERAAERADVLFPAGVTEADDSASEDVAVGLDFKHGCSV